MSVVWGLIYVAYFLLMGAAARLLFWRIHDPQQGFMTFTAHAFMTGVFVHVVLFNGLQWVLTSPKQLFITLSILLVMALLWAAIAWRRFHPVTINFKPQPWLVVLTTLVLVFSFSLWQLGQQMPNLAWDSWTVWEGKAMQWIHHGWSDRFTSLDPWLATEHTLYNPSPTYPDGLPLLYYWPKLFTQYAFPATHMVYLVAFALTTLLLVQRLIQAGAPGYLLGFLVVVLYTTPLLSNHLAIQGYADIWVSMFLLLAVLSLADYQEHRNTLNALTTVFYVLAPALFKLEGWAWVLTWLAVGTLVLMYRHRLRWVWLSLVVGLPLTVMLLGGLSWQTPLGDLVISANRLTLFNLIDTPLQFTDISSTIVASLLWQNNWLLLWLALPLVVTLGTFRFKAFHARCAALFLLLSVSQILLLFYFTEASQWALDFTAINRLWLQMTLVLIYLVFVLLNELPGVSTKQNQTSPES